MRDKFDQIKVRENLVNKYLEYKNLEINRRFSSNKKKIKKLDHYLWWLRDQKKRISTLIVKNGKNIFISTCDHYKFKNYQIIYSGLISCTQNTNLFDLLKAIKLQNNYLDKNKGRYCFISIDKENKVLLHHWKYFGYKQLKKEDKIFNTIVDKFNIKQNFNVYYKFIL
jgi:hypothetical protein